MVTYQPIKNYKKRCAVCGKEYVAKRRHSKTCSSYCRLQLFKHGGNVLTTTEVKNVSKKIWKDLSAEEHKRMVDFAANGMLTDSRGNVLEFFGGHKDDDGNVRRLVWHIKSKCLLEVWDIDHENGKVERTCYKCK